MVSYTIVSEVSHKTDGRALYTAQVKSFFSYYTLTTVYWPYRHAGEQVSSLSSCQLCYEGWTMLKTSFWLSHMGRSEVQLPAWSFAWVWCPDLPIKSFSGGGLYFAIKCDYNHKRNKKYCIGLLNSDRFLCIARLPTGKHMVAGSLVL